MTAKSKTSVAYYPGCALKERSADLERSALAAMEKLGVSLEELDSWTCCGAVPPPSEERLMNLVAPVRILRDLHIGGEDSVVTICDFCYNVLKRANHSMRTDELRRRRVNSFLRDDEPVRDYTESESEDGPEEDYAGEVKVYHLLEYLRDVLGYDELSKKTEKKMDGLKLAGYYGCVMLRPRDEIGLDNPERPTIIEGLISAVGAEPVLYPYRTECCGSYLSVSAPDASTRLGLKILNSARDNGADAVVVSCPLCFHNLEARQDSMKEAESSFEPLPVIYFTQLLAMATGIDDPEVLGSERHRESIAGLLQKMESGKSNTAGGK